MTTKEVKKELYNQLVGNARLGTRSNSDFSDSYLVCLTILGIMCNLKLITENQRLAFEDEISDIMRSGVNLWDDEEAIKEYDAGYIF